MVKFVLLETVPAVVVTTIGPDVVDGTVIVILVEVDAVTVAATPLTVTEVIIFEPPKP